jgi:hypothetical protein
VPTETLHRCGDEHSSDAAMHLAADLACLQNVERFDAGTAPRDKGVVVIRDAQGRVFASFREQFRTAGIQVPRPKRGVWLISCRCPVCEQPVLLKASSWARSSLPPIIAVVFFGLIIGLIGWFNMASLGMLAMGVAIFGVVVACVPFLVLLIKPRLLDSLSLALQIVHDVPRESTMWIIEGPIPDRNNYRELQARGMNQHKLQAVRRVG